MTDTQSYISTLGSEVEPFIGRRTMHEYVRSALRRAILEGQIAPGTRLVQSEIAEALDVSTTPVREALRDLASEGLIELDPHRGGIVHDLSLAELEEILRLRKILEPEALRRAWPRVTDEVIDRVETIHHAMQESTSTSEWVQLNSDFHGMVFDLSNSPRLLAILEMLTNPWIIYVSASLQRDAENQKRAAVGHEEILTALRNRDLDSAIAATVAHLDITMNTLRDSLEDTLDGAAST